MQVLAEDLYDFLDLVLEDANTPVHITSQPGAGKSAQIREYAFERAKTEKFGFFILNMALANVSDMIGYLMPVDTMHKLPDGTEYMVKAGRYTYPHWLIDEFTGRPASEFTNGIVLLEEWGQAGQDERKAGAGIMHDRCAGEHKFPHLKIVMLANPAGGRNAVGKELDLVINRRCEIQLKPTLKQYLLHANEAGYHALTMAYAARNTKEVFDTPPPDKQGPWLTARSLSAVDRLIRKAEKRNIDFDSPIVLAGVAGEIGDAEAHKLIAFMKARHEIPAISKIIADPEGCMIPAKLDVLTFLVFDMANKVTKDTMKQMALYVKRLPIDMGVTFYTSACQRDGKLVSTREFSQFAMDNMTLMSAASAQRKRLKQGII